MKAKLRLLWAGGLWAIASLGGAQTAAVLTQNFDAQATGDTIGSAPPAGWTVRTYYSDGSAGPVEVSTGSPTWLGWKFLNKSTWNAQKTTNASTKRGDFALGSNGIALIESDGLRAAKTYSASLETPAINVAAGKQRFYMHPVESRTGAIRLEDGRTEAMMLQLGNKSMVLNQKLGQRIADECQSDEQKQFSAQMDRTGPGLLDGAPKN